MSWRDELRKVASFRGIPFKVFSASTSVGRRNIVHQYPFRDKPLIEDMGKDADEFSIDGFILANIDNDQNYFQERDALISALREEGPGTLIHPHYGELQVSLVGKATIAESFAEGGIARVTMSFVQSETNQFPSQDVDNIGTVDEAADNASNDIEDSFGEKYNSSGPSFLSELSEDNFTSYINMQKAALLVMKSTNAINDTRNLLDDILDDIASKISVPCDYAQSFIDAARALGATATGSSAISEIIGKCTGIVSSATSAASSLGGIAKIGTTLGISAVGAMIAMQDYGNERV